MSVVRVAALVVLAFALGQVAAQATWQVESLIPDVISIRMPTTTIGFAVDAADYPPDAFPARYDATQPEGGSLPVQVFSNAEGTWSLLLEVPDLRDDAAGTLLPASQVLYRVNDGLWLRADGSPQIVYTGVGPTTGWHELRIDFALELTGVERGGAYTIDATVSAIRELGD